MIVDVYYYSYACQSVLNLCSCPKIFTVFLSLKSFILAGKFLQYKEIITLTCVSSLFYQTPQPASVKSKYFFYQLQKPQLHNMILEKFNSNLSLLIALSIYLVSRVLHAISFARNDFLSSIQGEQAVRALLKTENILKRLLKSKPESSSRIFF